MTSSMKPLTVDTTMRLEISDKQKAVGRMKGPPVSPFIPSECSSVDELSRSCFPPPPSLPILLPSFVEVSSAISSESSVLSQCSGCGTGAEGMKRILDASIVDYISHPSSNGKEMKTESENSFLTSYMANGETIKIPISDSSRQGRANQRWLLCPHTNRVLRPVSGCIPITKDGRIIFISSAKKKEWILPKGGWELDETLEQTAARESYEEAGVLGTLGPKISEVCFETRKGKKRRLDRMEIAKTSKKVKERTGHNCEHDKKTPLSDCISSSDGETKSNITCQDGNCKVDSVNCIDTLSEIPFPFVNLSQNKEVSIPITNIDSCDKCCMTLFPLYVTEVLEKWPEGGRARKVLTIDEALTIVKRDELRTVLLEVKRRGLLRPQHFVDRNDDKMVSEITELDKQAIL